MSAPTRLWLRLAGEGLAALGVLLLVPLPSPARHLGGFSLLAGAVAGALLFAVLARATPRVRLSRRRLPVLGAKCLVLLLRAGAEETAWRWLALGGLRLWAGPLPALAASTVGFALSHRQGRAAHLLTGVAFGAVYLASGSLLAAVAAHGLYNLLVALAVEAGRARAGPIPAPT